MKLVLSSLFVKICGITSEEDALMSIACGASAVGFVFAPSSRQVSPQQVHDIVRRLPSEALTVGVFRDEMPERVVEIVNQLGLSAAQLHGSESRRDVTYIAERVQCVIRALPATSPYLDAADGSSADYLLLDGNSPGSGDLHDLSVLSARTFTKDVIVAGGLTPSNVGSIVTHYPVWGVDVSSGVEMAPGIKDPGKVLEFVNEARHAFDIRSVPNNNPPFDWENQ